MKKIDLFEAVGNIDEAKIKEVDETVSKHRRINWIPYAAAAACAAVVVAVIIPFFNNEALPVSDVSQQKETSPNNAVTNTEEKNNTNITEYAANKDETTVNTNQICIQLADEFPPEEYALFALHTKDFVAMNRDEINAYYETNIFPTVPADLMEKEEVYGIYKRDNGMGELYWDYNNNQYTNSDGTRTLAIGVNKESIPFDFCNLFDKPEKKSIINNTEVGIAKTEYGDMYAEFVHKKAGFRIVATGLSEDEFVSVVESLLQDNVQEEVPADEGGLYMEAVDSESLTAEAARIFCGAYIDENGAYTVLLTEDTAENRAIICEEISINEGDAVWKTAKYTYKYLTELQDKISDAMVNKQLPFVVSSGVYDNLNCIIVGVTTEDEDEIAKVLAFDTIGGAIKTELSEGVFVATLEAKLE